MCGDSRVGVLSLCGAVIKGNARARRRPFLEHARRAPCRRAEPWTGHVSARPASAQVLGRRGWRAGPDSLQMRRAPRQGRRRAGRADARAVG